jgi:site-specific recombinase XerD
MNNLILQDSGVLTISEQDRIRIAAAWEALSVNSRRSYQGAWDRCGKWLIDRGISLDDLSDELMAVYIATLDAEGRTPATISVSVAAVKWFFANVRNEERNWQTTENKLRSIRRDSKTKGPGQVAPLTYNLVDRICSQAEVDAKNPLKGLRDSAIIRLMSDCLLRVSEVNCGDLKDNTLTIRQSKTDQFGEGRVLFVCRSSRSSKPKRTSHAGRCSAGC